MKITKQRAQTELADENVKFWAEFEKSDSYLRLAARLPEHL